MRAISEGCANTVGTWEGREIFLGRMGRIIIENDRESDI